MTNRTAPTKTVTRRAQARPVFEDDASASELSRRMVVGVSYGLVAWLHLILCPAYVLAGLLTPSQMAAVSIGTTQWALVYVLTALLMGGVAIGLFANRAWAWQVAPWCVAPNLIAHVALFAVLPVWGVVAITADLLVLWLVVEERRERAGKESPQDGRRWVSGPSRPTRTVQATRQTFTDGRPT